VKANRSLLAAAMAVAASAGLSTAPGAQQQQQPGPTPQPPAPSLSPPEHAAILPAYQAVQAQDWAAAAVALPAAEAGAATPYGRYVVSQLRLEIGRGTQNVQMQSQAVDAMLASGGAPAVAVPQLLAAQTGFFLQAQNYAGAEAPLTRLVELDPGNVERITQLAQIKLRLNKRAEALTLYQRVIRQTEAAGQRAPEGLYRNALAIAYEGRMPASALELSRTLVTVYPTPDNWRSALGVYRELGNPEPGLQLDLYRLMRATRALTSERDYVEYAEAANRGAMFGEVKAALEEGLARNVIRGAAAYARAMLTNAERRIADDRTTLPQQRTAAMAGSDSRSVLRIGDAYFSYGQYAEAAELYRAALQKGADANLANIRLGASLALVGQRAAAETAFRAVGGSRAELARFWLLWLSQPN
jgi:tetratricopeptide (TPR) repeat protein